MPLYEYYCSNCKSKFELIASYQHADDVVCSKCHSEKVRRTISTFAFPRGGGEEPYGSDTAPSIGSCGCGGNCDCH